MTAEEQAVINAITAKLIDQFYVGQRVKKVAGEIDVGQPGTITAINEDPRLAANGDYATWVLDRGKTHHTFLWALEPL